MPDILRSFDEGERPLALLLATALTISCAVPLFSADLRPDYQPVAYAIKGAKIVPVSGEPIEAGHGGRPRRRDRGRRPGDKVEVPYDAEVIEGKGLIVYPGFIDLYTTSGQVAGVTKSLTGEGRTVNYADFALPRTPPDNRNGITPEYEVAKALDMAALSDDRRKLGFTDVLVAPGGSIATGQSALVGTSGLPRRESVLKAPVALHIALRQPRRRGFGGRKGDGTTATA